MSTIKCAYIYPADHPPLPSYKDLEKQFGAKVLYGLRKHRKMTPLVEGMYSVEHAFMSVRDTFAAQKGISPYWAELIAFEDKIDDVWFSLATKQHVLTKFAVDAQIISQMHHLHWSIGHLQREVQSLQSEIGKLGFYQQKGIGDQQFFNCFPRYETEIQAFRSEAKRVLDMYQAELKALFSSGW